MLNLIIFRGPGGSGKSTVAKLLRDKLENKTAILCPDYFYWNVCGKDENSELVYEALYRLVDLYLSKNYSVILEGVLSSNINLLPRIKKIISLGNKYSAKTTQFYFDVSLKISIQRDSKRKIKMGKESAEEIYNKSINSKLPNEIIINTENKKPVEVLNLVLSKI